MAAVLLILHVVAAVRMSAVLHVWGLPWELSSAEVAEALTLIEGVFAA